jgi:hypothetical protein
MRPIAILTACLALAGPALAQRPAISSTLSPEAAAAVFNDAVITACIPAVTGGGVSALPGPSRAKVAVATDAETRRQTGAAVNDTVWDVLAGKGVVTIREGNGRCIVSAYGPAAAPSILALSQVLTNSSGFESLATANPGLGKTLSGRQNGRRVTVQLSGADPGTPGHQSRFSVVTATVFSGP